jgi:hypothetical protein
MRSFENILSGDFEEVFNKYYFSKSTAGKMANSTVHQETKNYKNQWRFLLRPRIIFTSTALG